MDLPSGVSWTLPEPCHLSIVVPFELGVIPYTSLFCRPCSCNSLVCVCVCACVSLLQHPLTQDVGAIKRFTNAIEVRVNLLANRVRKKDVYWRCATACHIGRGTLC